MKVYKTSKGYCYKEYKNGKKIRISNESYLKFKKTKKSNNKIIKTQKGGVRPCIVCSLDLNKTSGVVLQTSPVKHQCRICAMRYESEEDKRKQVFCGNRGDMFNPCSGDKINTICGSYHCKSKQWICNNCIDKFNVNFTETDVQLIQKIKNIENETATKIQTIIRGKQTRNKKYNLRTNGIINFLNTNCGNGKINAFLIAHGSIIFNKDNQESDDIFFQIPSNITFLRSTISGGHEYKTYQAKREKTILKKLHNMNKLYDESNINGEKVFYLSTEGKTLQEEIRKVIIDDNTKPYTYLRNRISKNQVDMGFYNENGTKSRIMVHSPGSMFPKTHITITDDAWIKLGIYIWNNNKSSWERFIIKDGKLLYIETVTKKNGENIIQSYNYKEDELNNKTLGTPGENKLLTQFKYNEEDLTLQQILTIISGKFPDKMVNFYNFSCLTLKKTNQTRTHLQKLREFEKNHLNKVWKAQGETKPRNLTRSLNTDLDYYNKFFELNYSKLIQKDKNLLTKFGVNNNNNWKTKKKSFKFIKDISAINPYLAFGRSSRIIFYDKIRSSPKKDFLLKHRFGNFTYFDYFTYLSGSYFDSTQIFIGFIKFHNLKSSYNPVKFILYNNKSLLFNNNTFNYNDIENRTLINTYLFPDRTHTSSTREPATDKLFSHKDGKIYFTLKKNSNENKIYTLNSDEEVLCGLVIDLSSEYYYILLINKRESNLFKIIHNGKIYESSFENVEKFNMIQIISIKDKFYLINYNSTNIDVYSFEYTMNYNLLNKYFLTIKLQLKIRNDDISKILVLETSNNNFLDANTLNITYIEEKHFKKKQVIFQNNFYLKSFTIDFSNNNVNITNSVNITNTPKYTYETFAEMPFDDEITFMKIYKIYDSTIVFAYLQDSNVLLILDETFNIKGKYLLNVYIDRDIDSSILCDIICNGYTCTLLFSKNEEFHTKELKICSKCRSSFIYITPEERCNNCKDPLND